MTPTPVKPRAPLPRGPFVLLGLMTATTLFGPFLIGWVLRGGTSPNWPPDRWVEWATVLGTSGTVVGLMLACLALAWTNKPATASTVEPRPPSPGQPSPEVGS